MSIKSILTLAMPSVVEQMVLAGIGFTDTIVAGHTGDTDAARAAAAGAVGAMTYLQWFSGLMTGALGVGATAIVARAIGAKRPRMANRVAGTAVAAGFVIGLGIALLFYFAAGPLVWLFGLHGLAGELARTYLRIMCWTICFQTAGQIGMACLRGSGDTVRPMLVSVAVTGVNALATWGLAFGKFGLPPLGIRGNAIGTLLSLAVLQGTLVFIFLVSGRAGLKLRLRHFRIIPHVLVRVARIAVPSWAENLLLWGGQTAIVLLVMRRVDDAIGISGVTLAAHTATLRIESLAFLPGYGFGIACAALVGQYLGARRPDQAERATHLCNRLTFWTMTAAAAPMVFFPHWMLGWMVDSQQMVELGWLPLLLAGLAQPGFGLAIIKSSALKGAGDTVSPMWTTMAGMGGRVVLVLAMMAVLASMGHAAWGLAAVWVCIFFDLLFRGVAMSLVFRQGKWKLLKV